MSDDKHNNHIRSGCPPCDSGAPASPVAEGWPVGRIRELLPEGPSGKSRMLSRQQLRRIADVNDLAKAIIESRIGKDYEEKEIPFKGVIIDDSVVEYPEEAVKKLREAFDKSVRNVRDSWRVPIYGSLPVQGKLEGRANDDLLTKEDVAESFEAMHKADGTCIISKREFNPDTDVFTPTKVSKENPIKNLKGYYSEAVRKAYEEMRNTCIVLPMVKTPLPKVDNAALVATKKEACVCVAGRSRFCKAH